jgi:hypothetical protein
MHKLNLFLIVLLISSASVFAQGQGISVGANVHFPLGEFADVASTGFGGSATYEHPLGRNITGVLYSGYSYFDGVLSGTDWSIVPLLAGAKFYISPKQDWYLAALIGASITTFNTSIGSTSSTDFSGNANFGYEIKTSSKGALDISAGYVYINSQNYIGLRIAYKFKL